MARATGATNSEIKNTDGEKETTIKGNKVYKHKEHRDGLTTQTWKRSRTPAGLTYIAGRRQIKTKHTKSHTFFLSHIINWSATISAVVTR